VGLPRIGSDGRRLGGESENRSRLSLLTLMEVQF
jgi:hypothetical protein